MSNVEQRIKNIEQSIRSLKASYPTAGTKVRFYAQKSQDFNVSLPAGQRRTVRIKFTPNYGLDHNNIVSLRPIVTVNGSGSYAPSSTELQDGSGTLVIDIPISAVGSAATFKIVVVASGTLPGTFSML